MSGQQFIQHFTQHHQQGGNSNAAQPELRAFWAQQMQEVEATPTEASEFKNHQLPLARIKKVLRFGGRFAR